MVIWKYPLEVVDEAVLDMPAGAKVLCVQTRGDSPYPYLWACVNPDAHLEERRFRIVGTGHVFEAV